MTDKHEHYKKDVSHLKLVDVYRIIELYKVTDGCFQHALKKILVPGQRGHKDLRKDIEDIIDTMQRKLGMMEEDELVSEAAVDKGLEGVRRESKTPTVDERIMEVSDDLWGGPYPTKPIAKTLNEATPEEWDAASSAASSAAITDRPTNRRHIARRYPPRHHTW